MGNRILFLLLVLAGLGGCNRNTDLLYHVVPPAKPEPVRKTFQIKDLQGDNKVDVLWVIDNSGSMGDDQQKVIDNTKQFMDEFTLKGYLDWRMGLISTDEGNAPFVGFGANKLDRSTSNPVATFQNAVAALGTFGSATEKVFDPVAKVLRLYPDFFRKDALLALVVITDAPEQSWNNSAALFLDLLRQEKGDLRRVLGYGVLWPTDWGCGYSGDDQWNYKGSKFEALFSAVSGKTYSLCQADFGRDLADMSQDIVKRVTSPMMTLSVRPKVSTIEVIHRGRILPGGLKAEGGFWLYDFKRNAVLFHDLDFAPDEKEVVEVVCQPDDGLDG